MFTAQPADLDASTPVVFVMHGVRRNADEYRDQWASLAAQKKFLLVVPEFSQQSFPGAESYNFGDVFTADGEVRERAQWSFSAIEPLFDQIRQDFKLVAETYAIYGHSAGAQFTHRFLLHVPQARVSQIVVANAGWYTLPDSTVDYPYGLRGSVVTPSDLKVALQLPVTILLGDRDTDPDHPSLRRTPEANAQGLHRFARGFSFFESARQAAIELNVPFNWHLSTVRGANHDNTLMAPVAIDYLLPAN